MFGRATKYIYSVHLKVVSYLHPNVQVPVMIRRLCDLQSQVKSRPTEPVQNRPQVEERYPSKSTEQQDGTEEDDVADDKERKERDGERPKGRSKHLSLLPSELKNGDGVCGSSSTRLLPDFVYLASPDPEDRQGGRGGGKSGVGKENGRKAKQKLNFTSSCQTEDGTGTKDASGQLTSSISWSEMSCMVIGSDYTLSPLSPATEQRLILQYLTPLGDYHEVTLPL